MSDESDDCIPQKRPKRAGRPLQNVVFSSDELDTDSDPEYQEEKIQRNFSGFKRPYSLTASRSQDATPGLSGNRSLRATGNASAALLEMSDFNDDEEERKARRRSRLLEMHQKSLNSPGHKTAERLLKANPLSDMSEAAIAEHYGTCIKLAAENKINAKNAFNLHLIDYMDDLLHNDKLENFQVASSSLDAGAKIYAGRVDAVHQETFKVLGGLGRSQPEDQNSNSPEAAEDPAADDEGQAAAAAAEKKRLRAEKRRKKNVIQKNLRKIRIKTFDLKVDVDPLFQHQAIAYDEGGTSELRLNNVFSRDNTSELVLDSHAQIIMGPDCDVPVPDEAQTTSFGKAEHLLPLSLIARSPSNDDVEASELMLCPEFSDFNFTGWNGADLTSELNKSRADDLVFNIDAEVENPPSGDISDVDILPPDDNSFEGEDANPAETSIYIGESKEAVLVQSAVNDMMQNSNAFVDSLRGMLTDQLNSRGQLLDNLLGMWAGPEHWMAKSKPILASKNAKSGEEDSAAKKTKNRSSRDKNYIAFDELLYGHEACKQLDDQMKKVFKPMKASISLTDQSVDRSMKRSSLLPPIISYEKQSLIQLMNKKVLVLAGSKRKDGETEDIQDYNYDNIRDATNYCPPVDGAPMDDHPDDDNDPDDLPPCGEEFGGADDDDNIGPFDGAFTQPGNEGATQLELISQPRKIAKIDIGYAKAAKRINVRRIKSIMWSYLVLDSEMVPDTPKPPVLEESLKIEGNVKGEKKFSELLVEIPTKVSKQTACDLSVPIILNCLLHLANEKSLKITNSDDFGELVIVQGIAPVGLRERAVQMIERNAVQSRLDDWVDGE